jgi:monoamine oxidase
MSRTPLATKLGLAASVAAEAAARDVSTEQVIAERAGLTRREVIAGGTGLALAAALSGPLPRALAASQPRIVVVGAGLAGLSCAYQLKQAGISADVYEASNRVGGRCWTRRGDFVEGQIAEHGGELIDQGHTEIRQLAQSLGLNLDNLLSAQPGGTEDFFYFDGKPYPFEQATDDLKGIWQQIHKDVSAASYPTQYNNYTRRGWELDHMSIIDYINEVVPGGISSPLGQLLDIAYNIEYGAESNVQSSLNLLYLLAYSGQGQLRIFGPSNEKYHGRCGNDQIVSNSARTGLADILQDQIHLGMPMTSIRRNSDGTYRLGFANGSTVPADRVVLALPFSILRTLDYNRAGFSKLKKTAIEELGMGTNSKLHVQFGDRYWYKLDNGGKNNGNTIADTGYQNTWEVTRAQPGTAGILVDYTGGLIGDSFGPDFNPDSASADARAQKFLTQIEPVLPGISPHYNGRATVDYWHAYPWTLGSYSYWKVGQYTSFGGIEGVQEGNVHFCGEHTSVDFQGYLNGGVETGYRAASEVLAALK